jgi:hypothetical protein
MEIVDANGKSRRKRIAIGLPTGDTVCADFAMSLANLVAFSASVADVALINVKSSIIQKGRHDIVEKALALAADKILFIDSDMTFQPFALAELLKSGKNVIGCNAPTKRPPIQPTCRDLDGKFVDAKLKGVREVGFIGTGFLLVDTEVFRKIGPPYFDIKWTGKTFRGEDYNFCDNARDKGEKVFCDFDLSMGITHLGVSAYGL